MLSSLAKFKRVISFNKRLKSKLIFLLSLAISLVIVLILIKLMIGSKTICGENNFNYSQKPILWEKYPIVAENCKNKTIIISLHRSGTSFLAYILQKSWPTFYVYEPLRYLGAYTHVREHPNKKEFNNSMQVLNGLFKCENLFQKIKRFSVIWNTKSNDVIHSNLKGINDKNKQKYVCDRCKHILLKTVRIDVEYMVNYYNHYKTDFHQVRSVVLFRDPRAILNSRLTLSNGTSFCINKCKDAKIICDHIRVNIDAIFKLKHQNSSKLLNQLTIIRYEDLSMEPKLMAKKLYDRLGLSYTLEVQQWIQKNTNKNIGGPYKISRKSIDRIGRWVNILDKTKMDLDYIQTHCADVMKVLGYKTISLKDIKQIKNINTSHLLANDFKFKPFLL